MNKIKPYLLLFTAIAFYSCNYFESDNPGGISRFEINVNNLKPLPDTLVYSGWIITPDSAIRIFERNVEQDGAIVLINNSPAFSDIQRAQSIRITVEQAGIPDTIATPGSNVILSGRFTLGSANITVGEGVALTPEFSGVYMLDTPTDTTNLENKSGVWFVGNVDGSEKGLNLPELYGGWLYEAWVEVDGVTLSCGRFEDPALPDDFSGYSGPAAGYPFPGEDFVTFVIPPPGLNIPVDLSGANVYVTLELNISNELVNPFSVKLLEAVVPADAQSKTLYQLQQSPSELPYGIALIEADIVE
jgi:hypothetical protein